MIIRRKVLRFSARRGLESKGALNNRPQKTLGDQTLIEVFCEMATEKGVAVRA